MRKSLDIYNESLTFSLVIWNARSMHGYDTIDLECDSFETYAILLHGFYLMSVESAAKRKAESNMTISDKLRVNLQSVALIWFATKSTVISLVQTDSQKEIEPLDPIEQLFKPAATSIFDAQEYTFDAIVKRMLRKKTSTKELKLSMKTLPPAQFLGWTSAGTQIWARLKMAGLEVKCVFSWDLKKVLLNVKCPQWRLEEVAEHIHMKLKNRYLFLSIHTVSSHYN